MSAVTETTQTASPSFLTGKRTGERRRIVNLNQYREQNLSFPTCQ